MEDERNWLVAHGFYCDRHAYKGPNTFLAGLAIARLHRKPYPVDPAGHAISVTDLDTADIDGDCKTDEEEDFFEACAEIGSKFPYRKWDHSKNWR